MAFALVAAINHLPDKNHILTFRLFQLISPNWNRWWTKQSLKLCFLRHEVDFVFVGLRGLKVWNIKSKFWQDDNSFIVYKKVSSCCLTQVCSQKSILTTPAKLLKYALPLLWRLRPRSAALPVALVSFRAKSTCYQLVPTETGLLLQGERMHSSLVLMGY